MIYRVKWFRPVVLKVGGFAALGAILKSKGAKKKGAIGGKITRRGQKYSTTNRSL